MDEDRRRLWGTAERVFRRQVIRTGLLAIGGLAIVWLATSDDPDELGPWIVGGVALTGILAFVLVMRRLR
jgi:hypothetical protein